MLKEKDCSSYPEIILKNKYFFPVEPDRILAGYRVKAKMLVECIVRFRNCLHMA